MRTATALSGMGVAAADYRARRIAVHLPHQLFRRTLDALSQPRQRRIRRCQRASPGLDRTRRYVGWGCGFFDFDNDGWPDLLLVNGHAFPEVDRLKIDIHYRERAILYRNERGKFVDISEAAGPGILESHSSRGAAFGDYDNDGAVEVVGQQSERARHRCCVNPAKQRTTGSRCSWKACRRTAAPSVRG